MTTITTNVRMRRLFAVAVAALLIAACDFRGPTPTDAILNANAGPFTTATLTVPSSVPGFGGGVIYYPTNTTGPFAEISVSPGFTEAGSAVQNWGPRLASHGFVTIIIDTVDPNSLSPGDRSTQQLQALDYVVAQSNTASSPIAGLVDGNRRGVMGHSMGGGASLISAQNNPSLRAAVGLAPWNTSASFPNITVPTMIVACQNDNVAAVNSLADVQQHPGLDPEAVHLRHRRQPLLRQQPDGWRGRGRPVRRGLGQADDGQRHPLRPVGVRRLQAEGRRQPQRGPQQRLPGLI